MRIIFINLHTNPFIIKTLKKYLTKASFSPKHRFILDYLLENNYEVACYINEYGTFLNSELSIPINPITSALRYLEYNYVMKKSGIDYKKIKIIKKLDDIDKDDIVILYNLFGKRQLYMADKMDAYKVVSMLHFFGTKKESSVLRSANINAMFAEANLSKTSKIFNENFNWFKGEFFTSPFVFQDRFVKKMEFNKRKNKAVAIGTLTENNDSDFFEVYNTKIYQPLRKQILDNSTQLADIVDSYITKYLEDDKSLLIREDDFKIVKFYKLAYNMFHTGQQKKYFSFDMVEKFNEYKICIVPEDIQGMPGVGFVEGMACGCAYIGLDYPGYRDIGMIPGKHYISYDGSIEDLRKKIEYYLAPENQTELENIANEGYQFAINNFSRKAVGDSLMKQIIDAASIHRKMNVSTNE